MLFCKDCDYYVSAENPAEKDAQRVLTNYKRGTCSYSGFVFIDDPNNIETEYPCNQK